MLVSVCVVTNERILLMMALYLLLYFRRHTKYKVTLEISFKQSFLPVRVSPG